MAVYSELGSVIGGATPDRASRANQTNDNFINHQDRITLLEGGAGLVILASDPASPADDTWWMVTDGASPQSLSVKARLAGVTYTFPLGTATT